VTEQNTDNLAAEKPATLADFLKSYEAGITKATDTNPEPVQDTPAQPELILGKFKSQEDVIKAYQEAERKISEQGQKLHAMTNYEQQLLQEQAKRQQYESMLQTIMAGQANSPEKKEQQRKNWEERYYNDPQGAIRELLDQERQAIYESQIKPLQDTIEQQYQQNQFVAQVNHLKQKYADFNTLEADIIKMFEEKPHIASLPDSVETAYNLVKARQATSYGPSELLQNPEIRALILANPDIKQEIINSYLKEIRSGQPPAVISRSGEIPSAMPAEIKSTSDARKASLLYFQNMMGSGQ